MSINLTGVLSDLHSIVPSESDIFQQVAIGAGASVVLAGLKSQAGLDAVDPLHIIHKPATDTAPATTSMVSGKSITSAAFNALNDAGKAAVLNAGYVIAG